MPRYARVHSETGIYHVMVRGNERKTIFGDEEDRLRLIDTIIQKTSKEGAEVYAYCLMDNHVHMLLGVIENNLARLMKRINVSYVYYYNKKYKRVGHLFQDRFRSENIENDAYLLEAVRYIHNNPVKAGIARKPSEYQWSSYKCYIGKKSNTKMAADRVLSIFSTDRNAAIEKFLDFSDRFGEFQLLDLEDKTMEEIRESQARQARHRLFEILNEKEIPFEDLNKEDNRVFRNEVIGYLKTNYNLSVRQMEKVTGIGRGTVLKLIRQVDGENRPC